MNKVFAHALLALVAVAPARAQQPIDPAVVEKYLQSTFGAASPEWRARMKPDETLAVCSRIRNDPSPAEAEAIVARESARVRWPADGKLLGDWKAGYQIANSGAGGQFSDPAGTPNGGNCYACHQMDPKEVSYGTLGPSLTAYGKDRKYSQQDVKNAYLKIYDSQAVSACSIMPRFGVNEVLSQQQIRDVLAYLFDPQSPVNQ